MKYSLIINFTELAFPKAYQLWELANFSQGLIEDENSPKILNIKTGKPILVGNILKSLPRNKRQVTFWLEEINDFPKGKMRPAIRFSPLSDFGISQLIVEGFDNIIENREHWLPELLSHPDFISARLLNHDYDQVQNYSSFSSFRIAGLNHDSLVKKDNGLPAPFEELIVDKTYHAGHWLFKPGYTEAVASELWLGERFFDAVSLDKTQVLNCDWLQTTAIDNVLHIKAYDTPFDSDRGEQREVQIKLRKLLYSQSLHSTDSSFANLDKNIMIQKV